MVAAGPVAITFRTFFGLEISYVGLLVSEL